MSSIFNSSISALSNLKLGDFFKLNCISGCFNAIFDVRLTNIISIKVIFVA